MTAGPDAAAVPRLLGANRDPSLEAHFRRWGQMPGGGYGLIDEVDRAGLRGRGGAAFPLAVKLRSVADGATPTVVANGTEREPVSAKDRALMVGAPHLVLDGVSIAAETVGAGEAIVCVDRSARDALRAITAALRERSRAGADRIAIRVESSPGAYVTGEESALVHWLNGGEAKPTFIPPRPYQRGVEGRPTLVNNVETLAHLALIARFRASWFRAVGTEGDPGTALVTVTGDVARPGVYEIPFGTGLPDIVRPARPDGDPAALLIGGYSGVWVDSTAARDLTFDRQSLATAGAVTGCAAICVVGPSSCGLVETASIGRWLAAQSAGQCGPCLHGLPAIASALERLVRGDRDQRGAAQLQRWLGMVEHRGACHHPDGVVRMVRSALSVFSAEIDGHRANGPCRARRGRLPVPTGAAVWR